MAANPTRVAVWSGIEAAAAYAEFLRAIAARDFDAVWELSSHRSRVGMRTMRSYEDFSVLFELWCESYPKQVMSVPIHCDDDVAIFDVEGDANGQHVSAQVLLRWLGGRWRIDQEVFRTTRTKNKTSRKSRRALVYLSARCAQD